MEKKEGKPIERVDVLKYQHKEENPSLAKKTDKTNKTEHGEAEDLPEEDENNGTLITSEVFRRDIKLITKQLKDKEVYLEEEQYGTYLRLLSSLRALLK